MRNRGGVSDLLLALLVVGIVGMMIVPLPTFAIDILISANITIAVVLLMVTVYVTDAMKIAAFPTILLLTTLFRLALNISSTRLILLQHDAGKVIQSFGTAVVRGDFTVGVIVFLVITIVQYIVIARGGERVAEVAARFTLDAMPGKQLAIDADVRTGAIDVDEARRRRAALGRESQMYGAMDGAMKFVKGDAIAGILIAIISVVGGLIIGAGQRGMSIGEAFHVYAQLTIGDALVSQIPALVISTAAGLIVTRVASEEKDSHLGREIGTQILAHPKALAVAAVLLAALALAPGMPAVPFLVLAGIAGATAFAVMTTRAKQPAHAAALPESAPSAVVEIGGAPGDLAAELTARLWGELGVHLPGIAVNEARSADPALPPTQTSGRASLTAPGAWRLKIAGVPIADGRERAGLFAALRRHAHELFGIQETRTLLDGLAKTQPALVAEAVPRALALPLLAEVLRRLVEEQISIQDLRGILSSILEKPGEKDADVLTEHVRASLRRQITFALTGGSPKLAALLLDAQIEEAIRDAVTRTREGTFLALEPEISRDIVEAVSRAVAKQPEATLLCASSIRRYTRRLVEGRHPTLAVVSYDELLPEVKIEAAGRVTVG